MRANAHLYWVSHKIEDEVYATPVVGDDELEAYITMAGSFGAQLENIVDVESELKRFVFDCYFEGDIKEWAKCL